MEYFLGVRLQCFVSRYMRICTLARTIRDLFLPMDGQTEQLSTTDTTGYLIRW